LCPDSENVKLSSKQIATTNKDQAVQTLVRLPTADPILQTTNSNNKQR